MLEPIFQALDLWIAEENQEADRGRFPRIPKALIRILGQMALVEASVSLHLVATVDVDAILKADTRVKSKFDDLLQKEGKHLDPHSNEIWMPKETEYRVVYTGKNLEVEIALADYVLISKALKAPEKNRNLILEYLAGTPTELFMNLAKKYGVDVEGFLT